MNNWKTFEKASDIRVGVVGYGGAFNMGKAHLQMVEKAGMKPSAVVEIDAERLKVAEKEFPGIGMFSSIEEMIQAQVVDLVAIITPHNTHAPLALKLMEAGIHVVCEKPLAITMDECNAMVEMAEKKNTLLSTFHNRHWDGCILEAYDQIINQKAIGDIVRVEAHMGGYGNPSDWWRASKSISGGVHYDWGVHLVEYALQLIQSDAVEVSGFKHEGFWKTKWENDTNEDEMSVITRFANGVLFNLRITTIDANPEPTQLRITGTGGKYEFDNRSYTVYSKDGEVAVRRSGKNRENDQEKFYNNVADALLGKADLVITTEWSKRPIEILALGSQSAELGKAIQIR